MIPSYDREYMSVKRKKEKGKRKKEER